MKNKIKARILSVIIGIVAITAIDTFLRFITGESFILQIIKAL